MTFRKPLTPDRDASPTKRRKMNQSAAVAGGAVDDSFDQQHLCFVPDSEGAFSRESSETTCKTENVVVETVPYDKNSTETVPVSTDQAISNGILSTEEQALKMEDEYDNDDNLMFEEEEEEKLVEEGLDIGEGFFLRQPYTPDEIESVMSEVKSRVRESVELLEGENGCKLYQEWRSCAIDRDANVKAEGRRMEQALKDAKIDGAPRLYQQRLFEIACKQNTVVHLGTGAGKTLVALMTIRAFSHGFQEGKQTLFMVPSVALAIQQSTTLRANLPFSVQVACYASCATLKARKALLNANVIVATHGAIHDLLMHYGDLFSFSNFNLVVVDECHYACGSHAYSSLLRRFYHTLPLDKRPRILGLTASPLVRAKPSHTEDNFIQMLHTLEETLDAKVVSHGSVDAEGENNVMRKSAEERDIHYDTYNATEPLPSMESMHLHHSRKREWQQLYQLFEDLGPLALSIYCQTLAREVSRNSFELESGKDFKSLVDNFNQISEFCDRLSKTCPHGGRSDKLLALEELLEEQIEENGGPETVGLVFVDRRITAYALNDYFRFRSKQVNKNNWTRARKARKKGKSANAEGSSGARDTSNAKSSPMMCPLSMPPGRHGSVQGGQFDDADDDEFDDGNAIVETYFKSSSPSSPNEILDDEDPFADADEDDENGSSLLDQYLQGVRTGVIQPTVSSKEPGYDRLADSEDSSAEAMSKSSAEDRFEDADSKGEEMEDPAEKEPIRCQALVRNSTQIFKSLNMSRSNRKDDKEIRKHWLHQEVKIRDVLSGLRRGDINVLIATSVVEEGVDVQACSFVVAFDSLKSTKGYIQMKGRARQKDAKFFVFQNKEEEGKTSQLSLDSAQDIERRVSRFIAARSHIRRLTPQFSLGSSQTMPDVDVDDEELGAVERGLYETKHATVDLGSAKGLVNRYVLSLPMDPIARSSKASLLSHLPTYTEDRLYLPSHLPASLRVIALPERYADLSTKEKEKILAIMACVRLHKNSLLSERLLPLTRSDLQVKMLEICTEEPRRIPAQMFSGALLRKLIVYPFHQENPMIKQLHGTLRSQGHSLAIISTSRLDEVPPMRVAHDLFGIVTCKLGEPFVLECNSEEFQLVMQFFKVLMDCRWRRRTRNVFFRPKKIGEITQWIPPYFVGCLTENGNKIDWAKMNQMIFESRRTPEERIAVVRRSSDFNELPQPRLWAPLYDKNFTYISYGPSEKTSGAVFPIDMEREGVVTYQDYFSKCRGYEVGEDCPLFDAQRLWTLPKSKVSASLEESSNLKSKKQVLGPHSTRYEVCEDLKSLMLPKNACMEVRMADPNFLLLCSHLPQFLHHIQPYLTVRSFIRHCEEHMPRLGACLSKMPPDKVAAVLTAKSCSEEHSYEKLEWLGDAVLKMVQTDSLLRSKDLSRWIEFLHEGDLSTLRSVMGCNERLQKISKSLKINEFLLTAPLGRGLWTPATLELYRPSTPGQDTGEGVVIEDAIPEKTCADVIEAILGLIYCEFSYEEAMAVADEMELTLPREGTATFTTEPEIPRKPQLIAAAAAFTGQTSFLQHNLVEEAFTHPTALHPVTPSYQRLEWVGDAVLCLAVREWIYTSFPTVDLGQMVAMEASLVANETLAYLSIKHGLLKNLNHCDQTLPSRIENYEWNTQELGRGLWGTDPPKVAADVVEALIGAVYLDCSLSLGIKSSLHILAPMLKALEGIYEGDKDFIMMHPKTALQEIAGNLLVMKVSTEEEFASKNPDTPVWLGKRWGTASREGNNYIGFVQCLDFIVVSVSDRSSEVAGNRACAFAVAMLRDDSELMERIQSSRSAVERSSSREEAKLSAGESSDIDTSDDEQYQQRSAVSVARTSQDDLQTAKNLEENGDIAMNEVVQSMVRNVLDNTE